MIPGVADSAGLNLDLEVVRYSVLYWTHSLLRCSKRLNIPYMYVHI
jgi:hypothetical protein